MASPEVNTCTRFRLSRSSDGKLFRRIEVRLTFIEMPIGLTFADVLEFNLLQHFSLLFLKIYYKASLEILL